MQPDRKYKLRRNVQTLISLIICLISSLQEAQCWLSLHVRSQSQEAGNKRSREGRHLRVVEDCLRQIREKPRTNPNLRARGRVEDRTTTLGAWSGAGSNRVLGRVGRRKRRPVHAIATKVFTALGTQLDRLAGDVMHALIWFQGPGVGCLFRLM